MIIEDKSHDVGYFPPFFLYENKDKMMRFFYIKKRVPIKKGVFATHVGNKNLQKKA